MISNKWIIIYIMMSLYTSQGHSRSVQELPDTLKKDCIEDLRSLMHTQQEWVKVHAAEYLIWTGFPQEVKIVFINEDEHYGRTSKYRIGIWRVLTQVAEHKEERQKYCSRILKAFLDTGGDDRVHAVETLAKLKISPQSYNPEITSGALKSPEKSLAIYTRWSLAYTNSDSLLAVRDHFLKFIFERSQQKEDPQLFKIAAFVLRQLPKLDASEWNRLAEFALKEPETSEIKAHLLHVAFVSRQEEAGVDLLKRLHYALIKTCTSQGKPGLMQLLTALALNGTSKDLGLLKEIYHREKNAGLPDYDPDVHATAAYALLNLGNNLKN